MPELHAYAIYVIFGGVILCIACNLIDMTLAALLGLCTLTVLGIIVQKDVINSVLASEGSLSLLFGGMVVARVLTPTGIFENVGTRFLRITGGSGKRFLLMMVVMVSVVCAILPNATAVILLAPIIIRVCRELKVGFVGPMIFTAMLSNSAGLLTLVGDPATFMVGQAMGMTFGEYLHKVSLGGVLAVLVLIPLMPLLLRDVWQARTTLPADLRPIPIERPSFCAFALVVLAIMVTLFLIGESIPHPIVPPAAAIIGASLALLAIHTAKIEPIENVLHDVDWKTIIFIFCMMCYVEQITKTGVLAGLSRQMFEMFNDNLLLAGMFSAGEYWPGFGFSCQYPGGGRRHPDDQGVPCPVADGAGRGAWHRLYGLA
jgi:Na+/H+ antiporter NhaD/arsenite permease-like protein